MNPLFQIHPHHHRPSPPHQPQTLISCMKRSVCVSSPYLNCGLVWAREKPLITIDPTWVLTTGWPSREAPAAKIYLESVTSKPTGAKAAT